tara:strand:+ start:59 stop:430 length:372 start_codon:yes stop_codon:yes gene_type:complete
MKVRSRKAKGRKLQDWVESSLRGLFSTLTNDDIRTAIMGESGADVKLSLKAKEIFPFDIECKNVETFKNVYRAYDQASNHGNLEPLLFIKINRQKPLVIFSAEHFFKIIGEQNVKKEKNIYNR